MSLPDLIKSSELPFTSNQLLRNEEYGFDILEIALDKLDYKIIITSGLANHSQNIPEGKEMFENIELYFLVPEYFPITSESWPVRWLYRIGEVPKKFNTWFGPGDTIPAGKPPSQIDAKFQANHFIVSRPIALSQYVPNMEETNSKVQNLAIIPIFQEELKFKLKTSGTALLQRLNKEGVTEEIDVFRKSVCRKRIAGIF